MCVCANSKPMYTHKTPNHKYSWIDPKVHLILRKQSTHTGLLFIVSGYVVVEFSLCPHMCVSKTWISVPHRVFQSSPSFQTWN